MKKPFKIILAILAILILALLLSLKFLPFVKNKKQTNLIKKNGAVDHMVKLSSEWTDKQIAEALIEYQHLPNNQIKPEQQKIISEIRTKKAAKAKEISAKNPGKTDLIISIADSNGQSINQEIFSALQNKKTSNSLIGKTYAQEATEDRCADATVPSTNDNFEFDCSVPDNVRTMLNASYIQIENIYGPKLSDRLTGTKDIKITVEMMDEQDSDMGESDYYCADDNTITLNPLHQQDDFVLKHELVHAFHHVLLNYMPFWEEGMAEAVTWLLSTDEQKKNNILQTYFEDNIATGWGQNFPGSRTSKGFYESETLSFSFRDWYDYYVWFSMANVKLYYAYGPSYFKILNTILIDQLKAADAIGILNDDYQIYDQQIMQKAANLVPNLEGYPTLQWFAIKQFGVPNNFSEFNDSGERVVSERTLYAAPDNGYSILTNGSGFIIYFNDPENNSLLDNVSLEIFDANNQSLGKIDNLGAFNSDGIRFETIIKLKENDFISSDKLDYYHSYQGLIHMKIGEVLEEFFPKTDSIYSSGKLKKVIYGLAIGAGNNKIASINGTKASIKNDMYIIGDPVASKDGLFKVEISPSNLFLSNKTILQGGKVDYQFYKAKIDSYTTIADLRAMKCCSKADIPNKKITDSCTICGKTISFNSVPIIRGWGDIDFTKAYNDYLNFLWAVGSKIDYSFFPINTTGWNLDRYSNTIIKGIIKN